MLNTMFLDVLLILDYLWSKESALRHIRKFEIYEIHRHFYIFSVTITRHRIALALFYLISKRYIRIIGGVAPKSVFQWNTVLIELERTNFQGAFFITESGIAVWEKYFQPNWESYVSILLGRKDLMATPMYFGKKTYRYYGCIEGLNINNINKMVNIVKNESIEFFVTEEKEYISPYIVCCKKIFESGFQCRIEILTEHDTGIFYIPFSKSYLYLRDKWKKTFESIRNELF